MQSFPETEEEEEEEEEIDSIRFMIGVTTSFMFNHENWSLAPLKI